MDRAPAVFERGRERCNLEAVVNVRKPATKPTVFPPATGSHSASRHLKLDARDARRGKDQGSFALAGRPGDEKVVATILHARGGLRSSMAQPYLRAASEGFDNQDPSKRSSGGK